MGRTQFVKSESKLKVVELVIRVCNDYMNNRLERGFIT